MVRQNWQGAWLERPGAGPSGRCSLPTRRAEISGPEMFLDANAVQNIGFALHELATNASKHGALHNPEGRLSINWNSIADRICLEWKETGAQPAVQPDHKGFGYLVLTQLVPQSLQGTATLEFTPQGCCWTVDFPATHVLTRAPSPNQPAP